MTANPASDRAMPHGLLDRLLIVTGLLVIVAVTYMATRPLGNLAPPTIIELDTSAARHDSGACWILNHPLGVESDQGGGTSHVELFEDGRPLAPHAPHRAMREGMLGAFSHWGDNLYIAASDGSDPTLNGRVYSAQLRTPPPAWLLEAATLGALGGALLTLGGLVLSRRRHRRVVADLIPIGLAAAAITLLLPLKTWTPRIATLWSAQHHASGRVLEGTAQAAARGGNVVRLLPGGTPAEFETDAALDDFDGRRRVTVVTEPGVEVRDGVARLTPGGPGLIAHLDPLIAISDIAEILLPIRVHAGTTLGLALRNGADAASRPVELEVPLEVRATVTALRVQTPLELFVHDPRTLVDALMLSNPMSSSGDALVELSEAVLASPEAMFLQATHGRRELTLERDLRPTAWQSVSGRYRVPLGNSPGVLLKGAVGLFGRASTHPVSWRVAWHDAQGARHELAHGVVDSGSPWVPVEASLPVAASAPPPGGELSFEVDELPRGTALGWSGWRLVDTSHPPRRVVFLVLDTLRRDALSSFGGQRAKTPFLDELATQGVRFSRAYSQAYWTRPSMPSLMTGRYVAATGVELLTHQLPESYTTVAEAFAESGFLTIADIANTNAGPAAGLEQGWDQMHHFAAPSLASTREQLSPTLLAKLADAEHEDLLLYLHLMDAHGPYGPYEEPENTQPAGLGGPALAFDSALDRPWAEHVTAASRRHWYYRDVETMDAGLAEFFGKLEASWGLESHDDLTFALTADHGEYLGEHGEWGHGWHDMLPEVTNVPMILRAPGLPAGALVEAPVENVDLAPTLLELVGLSPRHMPDLDGRSLLPLIRGDTSGREEIAMAEVGLNGSRLLSLFAPQHAVLGKDGSFRSWLRLDEHGTAHRIDPPPVLERTLLEVELEQHLESRFDALWAQHLELNAATRETLWADVDTSFTTVDPEALRQLEALGYLGR